MWKKISGVIKNNQTLILISLFSVILFSTALDNFFSGDDWFHLKVVQISSLSEFINFFNPVTNPQSTAFYRPIPNQLFFFIFYRLFGLWSFPYYVFLFALFLVNIVLFYKILINFKFKKNTALLAVFIFSISHTHFTRLNFLSAGQEIMMVCFFLAAILSNQTTKQNLQTYLKTSSYYALALLCKDSAIVLPLVIGLFDWVTYKKIIWQKMAILTAVAGIYIVIRFFIFDTSSIDIEAYRLDFSPRLALNTLYFYIIWAIGAPELLQDYLSSPIKLIERYYSDFQLTGMFLIPLILLSFISLGLLALVNLKKFSFKYLVPIILFGITIAPVLFLPHHKFTIQMLLPVMAFSLLVAWLSEKKHEVLVASVITFLVALNLTSLYITSKSHYTVQRSNISKKVYNYFLTQYPSYSKDTYFVFKNSNTQGSEISTWGSSKQISYALWGSNFAKVFFHDPTIEVYYEDIDFSAPRDKKPIELDSAKFL